MSLPDYPNEGFWEAEYVDHEGSLQQLTSSHLRKRQNVVKSLFVWGVWNGFVLGKAKKEDVPCRFCGKKDGDGHLFWECALLHPAAC